MTACLTYAGMCISGERQQLDIDTGTQLTAIVRGPEGSPQFYLAIISTWDIGVLGYIGIV